MNPHLSHEPDCIVCRSSYAENIHDRLPDSDLVQQGWQSMEVSQLALQRSEKEGSLAYVPQGSLLYH